MRINQIIIQEKQSCPACFEMHDKISSFNEMKSNTIYERRFEFLPCSCVQAIFSQFQCNVYVKTSQKLRAISPATNCNCDSDTAESNHKTFHAEFKQKARLKTQIIQF